MEGRELVLRSRWAEALQGIVEGCRGSSGFCWYISSCHAHECALCSCCSPWVCCGHLSRSRGTLTTADPIHPSCCALCNAWFLSPRRLKKSQEQPSESVLPSETADEAETEAEAETSNLTMCSSVCSAAGSS